MAKESLRNGLIVFLVTLGLAACGKATPYEYVPEPDQMKSGPGLFTGKEGGFVIFGSKPRAEPAEQKPKAKPSS